jgi:hypothetical protein
MEKGRAQHQRQRHAVHRKPPWAEKENVSARKVDESWLDCTAIIMARNESSRKLSRRIYHIPVTPGSAITYTCANKYMAKTPCLKEKL